MDEEMLGVAGVFCIRALKDSEESMIDAAVWTYYVDTPFADPTRVGSVVGVTMGDEA